MSHCTIWRSLEFKVEGNAKYLQRMTGMLETNRKSLARAYKVMGWTDFLHAPPIDASMNIIDFGLHVAHFRVRTIKCVVCVLPIEDLD